MPRVLVQTDDSSRTILMDEPVDVETLDANHSAERFIEQLAWGIQNAAQAERGVVGSR